MTPQDGMAAEFDTLAEWTADTALALGPDHLVPAGCRGSGGPRTLDRLLSMLEVGADDRLLDVGAGTGGPSAYAAATIGVRPVLIEPEAGACRAARRMFALPTIRAGATSLPIRTGSVGTVWSLGVLCTVEDQRGALAELARVVQARGRIGVLVYEAQHELPEQPEGNHFPTAASVRSSADAAGLHIVDSAEMSDPEDEPDHWRRRRDEVDAELERRHGDDPDWRIATARSAVVKRLITDGHVVGRMLVLQRRS